MKPATDTYPRETITDFDPFAWSQPNLCAVCRRRAYGVQNGVPSYFCAGCWTIWGSEFVRREAWVWWLYREEHSRRKRRTRRLAKGVFWENSLEEQVEYLKVA